tara:strand:- start:361 stop:549 length:189 start_codon:yes stop_codon:yes gene_type:complete
MKMDFTWGRIFESLISLFRIVEKIEMDLISKKGGNQAENESHHERPRTTQMEGSDERICFDK